MKKSELYHLEKVASLYVHVPFCRKKCPYCDFYSVESSELKQDYLPILLQELHLRQPDFCQLPTVYFGGGTPSLMPLAFFEGVLSLLGQFSEVTVEVNPEDAEKTLFTGLKDIGVNRISIGIQSLSKKALKFLGRTHSLEQALNSVENAISVFNNVSVDIIYGIPGCPIDLKSLKKLISTGIKHVSVYALTIYRGTAFHSRLKEGTLKLPEEEAVSQEYYRVREFLLEEGFRHYEISNFALPGYESRHNLSYWELRNYVGIGASASGMVGKTYWKNVSSISNYYLMVNEGRLPEEKRVTYTEEQYRELKIIMGLRLTEGINLQKTELQELFEEKLSTPQLEALLEEGYLVYDPPVLRLGEKGLFVSNSVISSLLHLLF